MWLQVYVQTMFTTVTWLQKKLYKICLGKFLHFAMFGMRCVPDKGKIQERNRTLDPLFHCANLPNPRTGTHFLSFTRQTVRFRAVHAGVIDYCVPQIADSNSVLPYHIMIFPMSTDQSTSIHKNPFIFWPRMISKYNLLLNSTSLPGERLTVAANELDNGRAYNHFLENTNMGGSHASNGISPFSFRYRDFCLSYDLCPDLCCGVHRHRPSTGKGTLQT